MTDNVQAARPQSSSQRPDAPTTSSRFESMEIEDEQKEPPQTHSDRSAYLIALTGVIIMVSYTWFLVLASDPLSKGAFAFHPPLQILAIAFFSYGILTLQPTSLAQPEAKAKGFSRHQLLMFFFGFPCIACGTFAIWYAHGHGTGHAHHAKTWHGTFGITALSWMGFQIIFGAGSVWFGGRLFGENPKRMYKYHRVSGYLLMVLFLVVIHMGGAWSDFSLNNGSVLMRFIAYLVSPVLIITGIASRIRFDKMPIF